MILNLNQEPKLIAEEAKLSFYPLLKTPYPSQYPKMAIELAINLIDNIKENVDKSVFDTWGIDENRNETALFKPNPKYLALSSALEIIKQEIK